MEETVEQTRLLVWERLANDVHGMEQVIPTWATATLESFIDATAHLVVEIPLPSGRATHRGSTAFPW